MPLQIDNTTWNAFLRDNLKAQTYVNADDIRETIAETRDVFPYPNLATYEMLCGHIPALETMVDKLRTNIYHAVPMAILTEDVLNSNNPLSYQLAWKDIKFRGDAFDIAVEFRTMKFKTTLYFGGYSEEDPSMTHGTMEHTENYTSGFIMDSNLYLNEVRVIGEAINTMKFLQS